MGTGPGNKEKLFDSDGVLLWGGGKDLELEVVAQHCKCTKCHQRVHFKMMVLCKVNFTLTKFGETSKICVMLIISLLWKNKAEKGERR